MKKIKIAFVTSFAAILTLTSQISVAQTWEWSSGLNTYYYRDNNGRVHYGDGSVSEPNTTWTGNDGRTVYSANSSGPKDQTGQYAIQAPRIDESSIGAAPTSPPAGYIGIKPGSNGEAVLGGTDPNKIIYVPPNSQGNNYQNPITVYAPAQPAPNNYNANSSSLNGQSYQVIVGPNGEYIYYFKGSNGENIYYSN